MNRRIALAARARSEELREEAQQSADALRTVITELERAISEVEWNLPLARMLREASGDVTAQVHNLTTAARQLPIVPEEDPRPAPPPNAPRVYIHIAAETQLRDLVRAGRGNKTEIRIIRRKSNMNEGSSTWESKNKPKESSKAKIRSLPSKRCVA